MLYLIVLWHAFQGPLLSEFNTVIENYNSDRNVNPEGYKVETRSFSSYTTIVDEALGNLETAPHLLQVSEYQTGIMMSNINKIHPIEDCLDPKALEDIADLVRSTFCDKNGKLYSLPFNPSCGVLYINKDALEKGGYDRNYAPSTFDELRAISEDLISKGIVRNGWTTAWPAAYHVEVRKAQQGLPLAKPDNGWSPEAALSLCDADDIAYFKALAEQQKSGAFIYAGRTNDSRKGFCEGSIAFYLQGAGQAASLKAESKFEIGYAKIPAYNSHVEPAAFPLGGASFWVLRNATSVQTMPEIRSLLAYLARPETQLAWHQKTAFVPVSKNAVERLKEKGFYEDHPLHRLVVEQTVERKITPFSIGIRLKDYAWIRERIVDAIEEFLKSGSDDPAPYLEKLHKQAHDKLSGSV